MAFVATGGCSSMQSYDGASYTFSGQRKLVVVELPMTIDEKALHSEFAPESPGESAQSRVAIESAVSKAEGLAATDMRKALEQQPGLTVDDSASTAGALKELALGNPDVPLTSELAQRLHAVTGADDLVRFRITDYGVTPHAWRGAYITFEVTSTLAIAGLAYAYSSTRALAGAYLVEESIEEAAEGYAGFWTLNEMGRPVRVEAELTSLRDGAQIWKGAATGLSDIRVTRIFRKVSPSERDAQRGRATEHPVGNVAQKMIEAMAHSYFRARP